MSNLRETVSFTNTQVGHLRSDREPALIALFKPRNLPLSAIVLPDVKPNGGAS